MGKEVKKAGPGGKIAKIESIESLRARLQEALATIEYYNVLLRIGNIPETDPVTRSLKEMWEIVQKLHAHGKRVRIDTRNWDLRIWGELELVDPKIKRFFAQKRLKAELLEKHGDKLRARRKKVAGKSQKLPKPRKRLPG